MKQILLIPGICLFVSGGCCCDTAKTLVAEPLQFCAPLEEHRMCSRNHYLAECTWRSIEKENPGQEFSPHYAAGFQEGFADYLDLGGTGAPPPVPPRRYWKTCYQTLVGHRAIEEWFAGFQDGVLAAQEGGYREWRGTIPTSCSITGPSPEADP